MEIWACRNLLDKKINQRMETDNPLFFRNLDVLDV